jgi:hypothetical protein
MRQPTALILSLFSATLLAAEPEMQISHVRLHLSTPDLALFEAVGAAALPHCQALSSSVNTGEAGLGQSPNARAQYELRGECHAIKSPAQAEALRSAVLKAFGKGRGSVEVQPVWMPRPSDKADAAHAAHAAHAEPAKGKGKKSCPDCEGK